VCGEGELVAAASHPGPSTHTSSDTPPDAAQKEQLVVRDVVVLIDREQGGEAHLAAHGLTLHAAFKLSTLLDTLRKHDLVDEATADKVRAFIAANQTNVPPAAAAGGAAAAAAAAATATATANGGSAAAAAAAGAAPHKRLSYEARAALAPNAVAKACFELMARKRTNLAVAADVGSAEEMLALADAVGPHICVFKTHVDIFDT
jgi:uridine monophosphate synthetase